MPVISVGASKGGVGKTTIAYELAAAMGGVLVNLDWDSGGATRMWGYDPGAFSPGAVARRHRGRPRRSAAAPSHSSASTRPRAVASRPCRQRHSDLLVADCLAAWVKEWGPSRGGGHPPRGKRSHRRGDAGRRPGGGAGDPGRPRALEGMLEDFAAYRLLLVPNMVPASPPRRYVERLGALAGTTPVAPPISEHRWMRRRVRRAALTLRRTQGGRCSGRR